MTDFDPVLGALLARLAAVRHIPFDADRLPVAQRFIADDGVSLRYLDWAGAGPAMMLLHGGALSAHTWDLTSLLLSHHVRCIALDMRGHGESDWADDYRIERFAADIASLAAHLKLEKVHLTGMSLGGCVAGYAAPLLGARLAGLTFVDVAPVVDFAATATLRSFIGGSVPAASIEDLVTAAMAVSLNPDPDLLLYRYSTLLRHTPEGWIWRYDRRKPPDFPHILERLGRLWDAAPAISAPVLVIRGARSRVLTDEAASSFAERFPDGRWAVVADAGHNVQEDNPAALAEAILERFGLG